MRAIIVLFLYAVGTALGLRDPVMASSFFIWSEIFRPLDFAWRRDWFPAAHLVAIVLVLSIVFRRWEKRWNPVATFLLTLTSWVFICSIFTIPQLRHLAMDNAWKAAKWLLPLVLITITLVSRKAQNIFVYTLALSVGIWSAQAGFHCVTHGAPEPTMNIRGGQMTDRNDFMVGVVAALPLMLYMAASYGWKWQRWVRLGIRVAVLLSIVAVFFSLSRGAIVGGAALLIYYAFATGRIGKKVLLSTAIVGIVLVLAPAFFFQRMGTLEMRTDRQTEGSAQQRLEQMRVGYEMAIDHPVVGVGAGVFQYVAPSYGPHALEPHNIWIKAAAEYGFPMLILFVLFVAFILRALGRERKVAHAAGDRATERLAVALSCSIIGFLGTSTFTSMFLSEYLWAIVAVAGAFLADRQRGRLETPAPQGAAGTGAKGAKPVVSASFST